MNTLHINNITKKYTNGTQALAGVELTLSDGMFGLLGPNGAGKSSLMRTIAGLQSPTTGTILFNGIDVTKSPNEMREQLGYLPQEFGVYPKVSAQDMLEHLAILKGLIHKKERQEQIDALLHKTNLYRVRNKSVHTFSGGMKRRFGIAQALLGNPKLIMVDEPTAGLDPEERNRFLDVLSEISKNVIVLLSTHIVDDVRLLCSKMAILNQGTIVKQGNPNTLISELEGKIWRKPIPKNALEALKTSYNVIATRLLAGETSAYIYSNNTLANDFEAVPSDLEHVYFHTLKTTKNSSYAA